MCWRCISWGGRCCVVSGAPGEQLLASVTSTNTDPRQQGPAPALQPPTPPVTCPHTGQGDFVPSWWKNDSCCGYNVQKSQGATSWLLSLSFSLILYFSHGLLSSLHRSVTVLQSLCTIQGEIVYILSFYDSNGFITQTNCSRFSVYFRYRTSKTMHAWSKNNAAATRLNLSACVCLLSVLLLFFIVHLIIKYQ